MPSVHTFCYHADDTVRLDEFIRNVIYNWNMSRKFRVGWTKLYFGPDFEKNPTSPAFGWSLGLGFYLLELR